MHKSQVSHKMIILVAGKPKLPSMRNPYGSEEALLDAFLRHERAAANYIYTRGWLFTIKYVTQNSGSEEDAKDIMQEAILAFHMRLERKQYQKREGVSCFTFLNAISKRLWQGELRKTKTRPKMISISAGNSPGEKSGNNVEEKMDREEQEETLRTLSAALDQMDEACQQVIRLGYFEGLSHKEIAEIMGYTEGYAKQKRHTCLERLMGIYQKLKKQGT